MSIEYVVLDIETTGLDIAKEEIVEIGVLFLDSNLDIVDQVWTFVTGDPARARLCSLVEIATRQKLNANDPGFDIWNNSKFVYDMHSKSGLIDEYTRFAEKHVVSYADVEKIIVDRMQANYIGKNRRILPMMGSTVSFDRNFLAAKMPAILDQFHYRNIDISTIKIIVDKLIPNLAELRDKELVAAKAHRTISDCIDTKSEFAFYKRHVFDPMSVVYV